LTASIDEASAGERPLLRAALARHRWEQGALGMALSVFDEPEARQTSWERCALAELYAFCGDEDSALGLLKEERAEAPEASLVRARVALGRADWERALRSGSEAQEDERLGPRATFTVVRALAALGRVEHASQALEKVRSADPLIALERRLVEAALLNPDVALLRNVIESADREGALRLLADAWTDLSALFSRRSLDGEARAAAIHAVELWDEMATSLPPTLRGSFWRDARRNRVRASVKRTKSPVASPTKTELEPLLANLRELAQERDLDKLLVLITDGAVSLTGAERGFVLLVDEQGALEAATVRDVESELGPETAAFSRSIAETVLIDGEAVVTVDATEDARVRDFLSVHQLMLKSVACVPIESRGRTWGVLYLEHRSEGGRFAGTDLSVLRAYADQAAIAIETSRLFEEVAEQRSQLQRSNEALRRANEHLEQRIEGQAAALEQTREKIARLQASVPTGKRWGLVGASEGMRAVYDVLDRVAQSDVPVAITGESGTGKELVAKAIHRSSARADRAFVSINCGAIPEGLLESELFGHVAGAFTGATRERTGVFAQAHGGTLFLDEVGDMPARMQLDLLRVLQEQRIRPVGASKETPIDVRLLTASKQPLSELIEEGKMREDLYYRLAVVELRLPPLRDRREDIPMLCEHFLSRIADERGEPRKMLSQRALQRLRSHDFPGNVRELEHLLLNAWVFSSGGTIEEEELAIDAARVSKEVEPVLDTYEDYKQTERERILHALNVHGWNRAKAARALGMARRTFYRRLKEHGIALPKE
jgi:transcriptional regulator with GAF, ATPase, and Fis domain